jgi:hypothetical protein
MIDSATMQFPLDVCRSLNLDDMVYMPKYIGDRQISNQYKAPSNILPVGIGGILVDLQNQTLKIDVSAKSLKDNYLEGITENTFDRVINTVNSSGIIEICENSCFEYGIFLKCDTTNNIDMFGYDPDLVTNWKMIYPHLMNSVNNPLFKATPYNQTTNKGISFNGDQKTEKNRLIAYCKYVELQTAKNKEFIRSLKNPIAMLNNTKNILRIEQNHTSFKSIRERMKIGSNKIETVLLEGQNPNLWMIDKITQPHKENQLVLLLDTYKPEFYSLGDIVRMEGVKNIIRKANYCPKTLKNIVKSYKGSFDYWWYGDDRKAGGWQGISKMINIVKIEDNSKDEKPLTDEIIHYIKNEMRKTA